MSYVVTGYGVAPGTTRMRVVSTARFSSLEAAIACALRLDTHGDEELGRYAALTISETQQSGRRLVGAVKQGEYVTTAIAEVGQA